jgi:hypothetical protein
VLDWANGPSSLAASLSTGEQLLEGRVDAAVANGVCWGAQSALVATLSHFLELEAELGQHRSSHNAALTEDQVDDLWILMRPTSDLLVSHVLPLVACTPDGVGE